MPGDRPATDAAVPPAPRPRARISARVRLTISYAGFLLIAGVLLLTVVWLFLLRYVPDGPIDASAGFVPNRSDLLRAFAPAATGALAFLLLLGLVGGWFLAGYMLAPLARIARAARLAGDGSLSHRVGVTGRDDEFGELAEAFDEMLSRLEDHVGRQQRFAANASHELRTPLAISQTLLDVAQRDPERDVDVLIDRLRHVNGRAIQLADALLLLSRSNSDGVGADAVDLALVAEEAAEELLPLAERRGVALEVTGVAAPARGSAALIGQMAVNLVHNAIVHNATRDGIVRVTTAVLDGEALMRVENTGPVLTGVDPAMLAEPFQRGGGRVRDDDHAGAGLGLAIVQHIVDAHGGWFRLSPRRGGGAVVDVRLPGA